MTIADQLANKKIAITGATGFLGTALVERLMRAVPDCKLLLFVRKGKKSTPQQRARREIFRNDVFQRYMEEIGKDEFWEQVESRVTVVSGDVGTDGLALDEEGQQELASCQIFIHSAATVSFEAALNTAIEVNLLGPTRVAETLQKINKDAHLIAVSTCYVAGNRKGKANEELLSDSPFHIDINWRDEVAAARRIKGDLDAESRNSDKLQGFRQQADYEIGAAGTPLLAAKTEQIRQRWVTDQLIEAGRARALSLGWPDAYAYTKALGERALDESKKDLAVSIVRPSIIESAWAEPKPGWIKGFRMAEPIILSYAKGLLKEFPGSPEGIIDVIPVDLVVAALINVAARGHKKDKKIDITQVASGTRNPLFYRKLFDLGNAWFSENPLYDKIGQPIAVPDWSFPGGKAVEDNLDKIRKKLIYADKILKKLPLRGKHAMVGADIEEKRSQVERAAGYVKIYGAYTECEALYGVENLLEIHNGLSAEDQSSLGCDPSVINWDVYVQEVHLPSVIKHGRVKTTPERSDPFAKHIRLKKRVLAPERQLAAFDLENTIIASNVVYSYAWLASKKMGPKERLAFMLKTAAEGPSLLALDKRDRTDFLRHFYRRYKGASVKEMDVFASQLLSDHILTKAYPAALRRVREHKRLGHRTLLITGALNLVVKPLKPLFDDIICAEMSEVDGKYTGELINVPPTGEVRAQALRDYAESHDLDLRESVAYADSTSDLPLLNAVGFPVAINPETRLSSIAAKRGWLIEYWQKSKGNADALLPFSPLPRLPRSHK